MKKRKFKTRKKVLRKIEKLLIKEGVTDMFLLVGNENGRLDWMHVFNTNHADTDPAKAIRKIMEFCSKEVPETCLDEHKIMKLFED